MSISHADVCREDLRNGTKPDSSTSVHHNTLYPTGETARLFDLPEAHIYKGDTFLVDDPYRMVQTHDTLLFSSEPYGNSTLSMEDLLQPPSFETKRRLSASFKSISLHHIKLPKKRPSLQSMFTPSFLQTATASPTIPPSSAAAASPRVRSPSVATRPGDYFPLDSLADLAEGVTSVVDDSPLLDDDPFANLAAASPARGPENPSPPSSFRSPVCSSPAYPTSPPNTSPSRPSTLHIPSTSQVPIHRPTLVRPRSSGHGQARPAYTKPAFAPRPSLPSLHTLAQMNIVVQKKARKGRPGARLPHEPWNMDLGTDFEFQQNSTGQARPSSQVAPIQQLIDQTVEANGGDITVASGSVEIPTFSQDVLLSGLSQPHHPTNHVEGYSSSAYQSTFVDDLDMESLPSLSYATSGPSSSAISRSSSIASSSWSNVLADQNSVQGNCNHVPDSPSHIASHPTDDADDPLSYHSDFDYYTQQLSDSEDLEPDLGKQPRPRSRSPSPDIGATPYTSFDSPGAVIEPGTSADTMHAALRDRHSRNHLPISSFVNDNKPEDSGDWRGRDTREHYSSSRRTFDGGERNYGGGNGRDRGAYNGDHSAGGHRRGHGDGDDGDKGRRPPAQSSFSSASEESSSSEEEGDSGSVYYSIDGISTVSLPRSHSHSARSHMATGSDDDVPLAQRIPTALTAQRTIRKQVRDERQQRRLERASKRSDTISPKEPPVPVSLPTRGATHAPRQRSISAAPAPVTEHLKRERTRHKPAPIDAFPVDDLTKKLASLQSAISPPATAPPGFNMEPLSAKIKMPGTGARTPLTSQGFDQTSFLQQQPLRSAGLSQERTLRPMRSFHRDKRSTEPSPAPADPSSQRLGRSSTSTHRRPLDDSSTRGGETSPRGISESASNNIDHLLRAARRSEDSRRPAVVPPRTSSERTRDTDSPTSREVQRPPVPPLPPIDIITSFTQQTPAKSRTTQQRIFVGDMQRFNIVEITPNTNAGDVIGLVASQGALDKSTGWMLWELAQDFGMERPIRSYELLSDVTASWNKDKMLNAFMIKTTRLASLLSRSNMPTSSPTNRGYVEWESKRGKWSKRWMELREHSLWLSKRDTGKDETFLCSLSNFDVYYVTRKHKSPKPFVFAVKSTDNLTLFEDASDYLHVFSCNQKDGEKWMDAILVARSYVLYQERHVLFAKPGDPTTSSKSLSRSGTRKQSSASRPAQPLVQVAPPSSASAVTPVAFEPGSLLAKRKGEAQS